MAVNVVRSYSNSSNFIMSTWFYEKKGDEAITCSSHKPLSKGRIVDHGCSFVLRGSGKEKEIFQEDYIHYQAGDAINDRHPAETVAIATSDFSVWCYICDKDSNKAIEGRTLFIPSDQTTIFSANEKELYIACPHDDIVVDGTLLNRKLIKKIDANTSISITSDRDLYIAVFEYE